MSRLLAHSFHPFLGFFPPAQPVCTGASFSEIMRLVITRAIPTHLDLIQTRFGRVHFEFSRQMVNLKGSILSSCEEKYFKMYETEETELKEGSDPILAKL